MEPFVIVVFWCPCMAINNVIVQYNGAVGFSSTFYC